MTLNVAQVPQENGHAGVLAPTTKGWSNGGHTLGANLCYIARLVSSKARTITGLKFVVSTAAGSDDACDVAILDATGARLASSGATTGKLNSTGIKTVTLSASQRIEADTVYYAALSCGAIGSTAATVRGASFGSTDIVAIFGTGLGSLEAGNKSSSHPIPSSIASPSQASSVPILALVEA